MSYSMTYRYPLSEREEEILQLIVEGRSDQEIASSLYITVGTVKVHRRNIIDKLEFVSSDNDETGGLESTGGVRVPKKPLTGGGTAAAEEISL